MPTLSATELTELRQRLARTQATVNWNKTQINAAYQAVEDYIEDHKLEISAAIDTATSPIVLSNPIKKLLVAYYFVQKALRDGAL